MDLPLNLSEPLFTPLDLMGGSEVKHVKYLAQCPASRDTAVGDR